MNWGRKLAGGGKSYLGCVFILTQALQYPDTRWVIGRKTLKALRESTLNTLMKIMKDWNVPFVFNQQVLDITFENGSKIILKELATNPSDPNYDRFGSSEYSGAFVDELAECAEKAIEVLRSRIRWRVSENGLIPKLLCSTNPTLGWVRSRFVQDDAGNPAKLSEDEAYVPFKVFDNPDKKFREGYIKSLEKIRDPETRSRLLHGNWNFVEASDGVFYSGFSGSKQLVTDLKEQVYKKELPIHVSFDFNIFPFVTSIVFQVDSEKKKIYVIDEILGKPPKHNKTAATAQLVLKKYARHQGGCFVYGDPSGKKEDTRMEQGKNDFTIILNELKPLNPRLRIDKSQPPIVTRGQFINEIFESNYDGWEVLVDMRCRKLTEDFIYGLAKEDGTKDKTKILDAKTGVKHEQYHHLSDAFDYFICKVLYQNFAKYKRGGKTGINIVTTTSYSQNRHSY